MDIGRIKQRKIKTISDILTTTSSTDPTNLLRLRGSGYMKTQKKVLKQIITFLIILSILTIGVYFWMFNSSEVNTAMIIITEV